MPVHDKIIEVGAISAAIAACAGLIYGAWRKIIKPCATQIKLWCDMPESVAWMRQQLYTNGSKKTIADLATENRSMILKIVSDLREVRWIQARQLSGHIVVCDTEGRNLIVSDSFAALLGVRPQDLLGHKWRSFVSHDDLPEYEREWRGVFGDARKDRLRVTMIHADGTPIPVEVDLIPHLDGSGTVLRYMGRVSVRNQARPVEVDEPEETL